MKQTPDQLETSTVPCDFTVAMFVIVYGGLSRTRYRTLTDAVAGVAARGPGVEPGATWRYSDAGSGALGAIVETVSGKPLGHSCASKC